MTTPTTAIVAEGGGQRGIYTAGVLDAFLDAGFNPFHLGIGVSAGAQNLLAFFLGQRGYAKRAITELTSRADFMVSSRCVMRRSMLDLDGYFETSLNDPDYRLPYEEITQILLQRRLQFVATNRQSLAPVYLEPDASNVVDYLKASSAVPFLYRRGVASGSIHLIDGGVAGPLPLQHAYSQGARELVLIRTVPAESRDNSLPQWFRRWQLARRWPVNSLLPARMLARREKAMLEAQNFMRHPPRDLRLHIIAPSEPLKSQWIASPQDDLMNDYRLGLDAGSEAIVQLRSGCRSNEPASEQTQAVV